MPVLSWKLGWQHAQQKMQPQWVEGGSGTRRPFKAEARLIHPTPGEPAQKETNLAKP